jgi:hypothetical protein
LAEKCETVSAWHSDNDLPLLWPIHSRYRSLLFELIDLMNIGSAMQDRSLLDALAIVHKHRHTRRNEVLDPVDLGFASLRWQNFIRKRGDDGFDRRTLEVCVFIHIADALQARDIYVVDAEDFADYRAQLLLWSECEPRMAGYCAALGIPERGVDFAAALKAELTSLAEQVDAGYPANSELSIDRDGAPHLKHPREQPHRFHPHSLRRLWRHRVPPYRRHIHRLVHQLHLLRRLGGRPHPGCAHPKQVQYPAGHAPCRYPGTK